MTKAQQNALARAQQLTRAYQTQDRGFVRPQEVAVARRAYYKLMGLLSSTYALSAAFGGK
jgi:hypothetical protein